MNACPVENLEDLCRRSSKFFHWSFTEHGYDTNPSDVGFGAASLVNVSLSPSEHGKPDAHMVVGGNMWIKQPVPCIKWIPGPHGAESWLYGRAVRARHCHGNLSIGGDTLHLDYFQFMTWGPLSGCTGFLVSKEGEGMAAGGHWCRMCAGSKRNWPIGLIYTDTLLTIAETVKMEADVFTCCGVALWKQSSGLTEL